MSESRRPYSVQEAAAKLGISDKLLYRMVQTRRLPGRKIGARVLIPAAVIDRLCDLTPAEIESLRRSVQPAA